MSRRTPLALVASTLIVAAPTTAVSQTSARPDPIALAVLPLPDSVRVDATVLGYEGDRVVTLRRGTGDFVCLTDRPDNDRFQVACYHKSLEPYMARGRALRTEGISGHPSIEKRWEEIEAGTLPMPRHPAALFQMIGRDTAAVAAGDFSKLTRLTVIYLAYATGEDTGLSTQPAPGVPWLMYSGKPTAHVMIMN